MGNSIKSANFLLESRLADAARGKASALYDLAYATRPARRARRST